jgi:sodium/bile acid cotransporter 7
MKDSTHEDAPDQQVSPRTSRLIAISRSAQGYSFILLLVGVLVIGLQFGRHAPESAVRWLTRAINPSVTTFIVLWLMSWTLETRRLRLALMQPGAALLGTFISLAAVPAITIPVIAGLGRPDFSMGLFIVAVAPCTISTAVVWTRRAEGNDAVALLVTMLTNALGVAVAPLWLAAVSIGDVDLPVWQLMTQLAMFCLLPTLLGQVARGPRSWRMAADHHRGLIGQFCQFIVLTIIFRASLGAGLDSRQIVDPLGLGEFFMLLLACGAIHVVAMLIGWIGGLAMREAPAERTAVIFSGSQKTLPVSLLLAIAVSASANEPLPLITLPILAYHALQLVIDSLLAERWRRRHELAALSQPA